MRAMAMHDRTFPCPANGAFDRLSPIDAAVPGAEIAIFQMPPGA